MIEGSSYTIGVDFTKDNGSLRGEAKKIYKIEEVIRMNSKSSSSVKISTEKLKTNISKPIRKSILKIYADENNFSLSQFKQIKLLKGAIKIQIIYVNQRLELPGEYEVNSNLVNQIELLVGVKNAILE